MPIRSQIHIDTLLSNVSVKYANSEYIADQMFPIVPVMKSSDLYRVYDRNFRLPESSRANKGEAREAQFDVSSSSYVLEKHGLKELVSDSDADNYDLADLRAETTEFLTDKILLRREKMVFDLLTSTSWSLNVSLAATAAWSLDTVASNPIPICDTAATTVIANSGKKPNFMAVNRATFVAAKNHQSVLDRTKYVGREVDVNILASLFGVESLLVSNVTYDSAQEGAAASVGALFPGHAFLGWKPSSASPLAPSAGYIFQKKAPAVKRYREEKRDGDMIEVNMEIKAKVVASLCGYLIKATV